MEISIAIAVISLIVGMMISYLLFNGKKKLKESEEELRTQREKYVVHMENKQQEVGALQKELASKQEASSFKHRIEIEAERERLSEVGSELSATEQHQPKVESLDLIQELLSADEVRDNNEQTKIKHAAIDSIVSVMRTDIKHMIDGEVEIQSSDKDKYFGEPLTKWAITAKKDWIQNRVSIVFVGERSVGKTSIVNRILSQDDSGSQWLPVSANTPTAIPTYISGDTNITQADYQFVTPTHVQKSIGEAAFKKMNMKVLNQIDGGINLIQYFIMRYNNPVLNKLSILDTPGFNFEDKEETDRIVEGINESDVLFWVIDVNSDSVNRHTIDLIKQNVKGPLYVVINKADTKSQKELGEFESLFDNTLQEAGLYVESFIRFSTKADLSSIMIPISEVQPDTSQMNYLDGMISFVESYFNLGQQCLDNLLNEKEQLDREIDDKILEYVGALKQLQRHCEAIRNIPQYMSNAYQTQTGVSEQDRQKIVADFNSVYKAPAGLANLFDNYGDTVQKSVDLASRIAFVKEQLKQLEHNINKIRSNFNIVKV